MLRFSKHLGGLLQPAGRPGIIEGEEPGMRLVPEMTYTETIAGPWGPTSGSPLGPRLCWQVTSAELVGDRIRARLAMPGADWIRLGPDGIRRPDQRLTFVAEDNAVILLSYDDALIRESPGFLSALHHGGETGVDDQYMRMVARFETGEERFSWLTRSLFIGEGRLAGDHRIEYVIHRLD